MVFDKDYQKACEDAMAWLNRDIDRRGWARGLDILARMRFKPLLHRRLSMHGENAMLRRVLAQALRDGINVSRNPSSPKYADIIPAEVEAITSGTAPSAEEESATASEEGDTEKFASYPRVIQRVVRHFAKLYKERDRLHREMSAMTEANDSITMERRKALADRIDLLSGQMDKLWSLRTAWETGGALPTEAEVAASLSASEADGLSSASDGKATGGTPDVGQSSFRIKDEDFKSMDRETLRARKHTVRSQLVKKRNLLRYQSERRQEKDNPMPISPARTKMETQMRILEDKLYEIDKALALLG